ncbi:MAG: HypC/HybG/HupF family hydrogenase formation chaperone [Actinomycetota bacterium]|nr:HypC/HybG/HupF family hydrogenase formation chaperone [Actinomycetota bacterium]
MCLGIPGQIVEIGDASQLRGKVEVEGVRREVSIALIGLDGPNAARVGDWVLVHVGFAMAKIDEDEARETLNALKALGDLYEQELTDYSAEIQGLADPRSDPAPVVGGPS